MNDEELVRFLITWGRDRRVMYGLVAMLVLLLWANYKMWRRIQRQKKENEVDVSWTDNDDEVEVRLPLPAAVTKSDIKINVLPTSIEVFMKLGPKAKWEAKPLMEASSRATLLLRGTRAPHRP